MLLYTVVKEVNPPQFAGTSTGVIGFLNFTFTALVGPVFGTKMQNATGAGDADLVHYQLTFQPLLYGVALAILLTTVFLRETGRAARAPSTKAEAA